MMHVTQYRPAFFWGFENEEHDVDTAEQLLALPFVKNFCDGLDDFHQFAMSGNALVAEYKDGAEWWVVAHIDDPRPLAGTIPAWDSAAAQKKRAAREAGQTT